jgi:hypothetical protein
MEEDLMRYRFSCSIRNGLVLISLIALAGCSWFGGGNTAPRITPTPAVQGGNGVQEGKFRPGTLSSTIDTVAEQVLVNMHLHAYNPKAMTKGKVTGGLYINWKMDNPSITNAVRPAGSNGDPQTNHDPQVDLFYLASLADYHVLHPQDHTFDADVSRITDLVLADYQSYNQWKGWVYFFLLRSGQMLQNQALVDEAHAIASRTYKNWYDASLGFVYDHAHKPMNYSPNLSLQAGAALIDAGLRWKQSDWVSAGEKTIDHVIASAISPQYHLFYTTLTVQGGHDEPENYKAKPNTQAEAVTALLAAYNLTHRQQYLDVSGQILQTMFGSSGLWDPQRGGLYFALDMSNGKLLTSYKETRSQTHALISVHDYNLLKPQFVQQERQLVDLLTGDFYQHTYHGYFYRVTSDFQVFVERPGQGTQGVEAYFTTEAMGSALDALQQTELNMT